MKAIYLSDDEIDVVMSVCLLFRQMEIDAHKAGISDNTEALYLLDGAMQKIDQAHSQPNPHESV